MPRTFQAVTRRAAGILQDEGHATRTARNSDEALSAVVARRPNLVILDIWLRGSRLDGLQLLDSLNSKCVHKSPRVRGDLH
jgi:DNA-binding NtrC family response regulator